LEEHGIRNAAVVGSNPTLGSLKLFYVYRYSFIVKRQKRLKLLHLSPLSRYLFIVCRKR
jgi:hypothetical protein